jgi:predicted ATPase
VRCCSVVSQNPGLTIERTQGNLFFMEETVQALLDEGALARNGGIELIRPLGEVKIPPTVQAVLAARIDRLPFSDKELLQTLAVIGKELAVELIEAVNGKSKEQLEPMLANLQFGEFIYEQPRLGRTEYTFKHALTKEVAYNSLLAERRRAFHVQTARAIETLYSQHLEDHCGALFRHYSLGNEPSKALHYAQLTAEQALIREAYPQATITVDAAVKLLDRLPGGTEQLQTELSLREIESTMAFILCGGGSSERERVVRRMCELGEQLGGGAHLLRGLIALSSISFQRAEHARGLELARRCVELAEAAPAPDFSC